MKQERSAEEFQRLPVWKAVLKNALPAMVAMLRKICHNYDIIHIHHPDPTA